MLIGMKHQIALTIGAENGIGLVSHAIAWEAFFNLSVMVEDR
jgi:hypothetical protein